MEVPAKRCRKCNAIKPLPEFAKSQKSNDGRTIYCKECLRLRSKADRDRAFRVSREAHAKKVENTDTTYYRRKRNILASKDHYTEEDVKLLYKRQQGKCYYCKIDMGNDYTVDHVIPLKRGGSDGPENIVIACGVCNSRKGSKLPHEWKGNGGRLI